MADRLSEERRGQIALAMVKAQFRKEGLKLSPNFRRELGAKSQELRIPVEDLEAFVLDILPEMLGIALGYSNVSLTVTGRKKAME